MKVGILKKKDIVPTFMASVPCARIAVEMAKQNKQTETMMKVMLQAA